jgi:hypothetical protein
MTPVTGEMIFISPVTEMAFCHFGFLADVFASFSRVLDLFSRVFIFLFRFSCFSSVVFFHFSGLRVVFSAFPGATFFVFPAGVNDFVLTFSLVILISC